MRLSKIPAGFWPVQSREHLWPLDFWCLTQFLSFTFSLPILKFLKGLFCHSWDSVLYMLSSIHCLQLPYMSLDLWSFTHVDVLKTFFFFASLLNTKSLGIWLVFIVAEVCVEVGRRDPVGKNTLLFLCSWHQLLHLICLCRALCLCRLLFYFWQFPLHYGSPSLSYLESYQEIRCERWTWPTSLVQTNY